jgi:hypothetical protein
VGPPGGSPGTTIERLFALASELLRAYEEAGPHIDDREPARFRLDAAELIERGKQELAELRAELAEGVARGIPVL